MNYLSAVEEYKQNPTAEVLSRVTDALVGELTTKEKIWVLQGHSMGATMKSVFRYGSFYNAFPYPAGGIKRLGIPPVLFTDGPRGIVMGRSTAFPVSMLRGATFDDELEYRVGKAIAQEGIAQGANYYAGVCINLLRHPKWGRAQETYGEDTYLLGRMGAALTRSVQDLGMIACPKHFALNSIEDLRFKVDAVCDERTLREVYLPHFRKCIQAGALSVMGAYNRVNGTYCCENAHLMQDILRDDWGFEGFTLSDFLWGVYDAKRSLEAGMDIEMPYKMHYRKIASYIKKGQLTEEQVTTSAKRVIRALIHQAPLLKRIDRSTIVSTEHLALAREVATKGMVLLKNDGVLPITNTQKKIAVIGRYANKRNIGDHGSSNVSTPVAVTPYEGLASAYGNARVYNGTNCARAAKLAADCDYAVVCVGSDHFDEGEFLVNIGGSKKKSKYAGGDRASLRISESEEALIRAVAATGVPVIVNIIGGSAYVLGSWVDEVSAVMMSFYSGSMGGMALCDLVSGKACPSGHLPFTMAAREEDYPPFLHLYDTARSIEYGYWHGYRLFDHADAPVLYPFGFGLSYTQFSYSDLSTEQTADGFSAKVTVTNTGDRAGDTVVQIYAGGCAQNALRAKKTLCGFARVSLAAGETKSVRVQVLNEDIAFYDTQSSSWVLDEEYKVYAAQSARDEGELVCTYSTNGATL